VKVKVILVLTKLKDQCLRRNYGDPV